MKILVLGLAKSGTTALLYRLAGGLPGSEAVLGGLDEPVHVEGNLVRKITFTEHKNRGAKAFEQYFKKFDYDRKVWILRDPRDISISSLFFRWKSGAQRYPRQFKACLKMVKQKERDPESISFLALHRHSAVRASLLTDDEVRERELKQYVGAVRFLKANRSDFFMFKYEDMIRNRVEELREYLGFDIPETTEMTGRQRKVIRKKSSGDWRHWYTNEDVAFFRPLFGEYLKYGGYDEDDWLLSDCPSIEPEYSSEYMKKYGRWGRMALSRILGRGTKN